MAKLKTKAERSTRSKIYDMIYYESLKEKDSAAVTAAQLAKISGGGAR